jgi:polyphenol oxidase
MAYVDSFGRTNFLKRIKDGSFSPTPNIKIEVSGIAGFNKNSAYIPKQVHGTEIVEVLSSDDPTKEADGSYTFSYDCPVAVRTADCLPLVLYSPDSDAPCMGIHAGWRGFASNIIGIAQDKIKKLGFEPGSLHVFIGPAISAASFEIGPDVLAQILKSKILLPDQFALCSLKGCDDRWHFDLQQAAVLQLINLGVKSKNITVYRDCTMLSPSKWYSYRRESKKSKQLSGHNFLSIQKIRE